MGERIAVLSGKGGTGKTSVCAGLAIALAQQGKNVLCIDCDMGLRNLDISLGMSDSGALSFLDVTEGGYDLELAARHTACPNLRFLTAPINRRAERIHLGAFREMLLRASEKFDYIFLDGPAGLDAGFQLAAKYATRAILVTGADPAAVRDAGRTAEVLSSMGKRNVRLIVNRVNPKLISTMSVTVDDVMDEAGVPLLGLVPEDSNVVLAAAFGKSLSEYARRSPAARAFNAIANRIQGLNTPLSMK